MHKILSSHSDRYDIETGLDDLNRRISACEDVQNQYELSLTDEEIDAAIDEVNEMFENARSVRAEATRALAHLQKDDDKASVSSSHSSQAVKLPKLELAHFNGDVTQWTTWWDNFKATIHDSDLADVTKFSYLQSLLVGEAASVIRGLTLTSDHYKVACDLLGEHFGRK